MLFLNSWMVSSHTVSCKTTNPPAIQKQHWHSSEAQNEPPLIECECEWAFGIQAKVFVCIYEQNNLVLFRAASCGFKDLCMKICMTTDPPAIQKQHWHSREAQIEPPLCECEWAFGIQAKVLVCIYDQNNLVLFRTASCGFKDLCMKIDGDKDLEKLSECSRIPLDNATLVQLVYIIYYAL
jgi:hypothetical protein